jgi:hypothetical protein
VGVSQQPGHWSADCPAFRRRPPDDLADFAGALDELACAAGVDDGLVLLQKQFGVTPEQVAAASRAQAAEWFRACYARHGGARTIVDVDLVCHPCGIFDPNSGWAPGPNLRGFGP